MVWPSGFALERKVTPTALPAPGRVLTTTVPPSSLPSALESTIDLVCVVPPAL